MDTNGGRCEYWGGVNDKQIPGRKSRFEEAADLHKQCSAAYAAGKDFPTIYAETIRGNPVVVGMPVQGSNKHGPFLQIKLASGQQLVFHAGGFSLR
jgi:hypothetical protein